MGGSAFRGTGVPSLTNNCKVTNENFVLDIRSTRLSLTASLKAAQVASSILLMQSIVRSAGSRVLVQSALQRYNAGNNTAENWSRAAADLQAVFDSGQQTSLLLQALVYPTNSSGPAGGNPVLNATGSAASMSIQLPYNNPNGTPVMLGDDGLGFPPLLYPNLTFSREPINSTFSKQLASYDGRYIDENNYLLLGPWSINETFTLLSMTIPVINNTSNVDILGWLTVVLDGHLITDVVAAQEGLDDTGVTIIAGPASVTNKFPTGVLYTSNNGNAPADESVRFVVPPTNRTGNSNRHPDHDYGSNNPAFDYTQYPAIKTALVQNHQATNNAGSLISTTNEEGDKVAVGYAIPATSLVDWVVLVEQSKSEVYAPLNRFRNVLLACLFGTLGAMLILAFPVAHFSVMPIRRLRDATKKSVDPPGFSSEQGSDHSDIEEDDEVAQIARKEGLLVKISRWTRRSAGSSSTRREEARRRQFRIPGKVREPKHFIHDELTDLTHTFNEMTDELMMQYEKLEERVAQRTAELEMSKKAAEAANESKTLFIANISHELKTPLNGILGMCAVCMSEDDPIKVKRSLGIIYKSGDLLLNLLTDLLTFSKNQVGQALSLDEKDFRLRDISSQILAIFDKQAKDSDITLKVLFEGMSTSFGDENEQPVAVSDQAPFGLGRVKDMVLWGDQHRILQVVINLVSNSLKFTPKGGSVTLTIRCNGDSEISVPGSRKASVNSRQTSGRNSRTRHRGYPSSETSVATVKNVATANEINAVEKSPAFIYATEQGAAPPPGRDLAFDFVVTDTGPGIPEQQQQRIFEPFVQGDLGLSKKYGGTGLGLSICSQLASLMRGTIGVKSEVGHGSTFTMEIPLRHLSSRADSTASSSHVSMADLSRSSSIHSQEPATAVITAKHSSDALAKDRPGSNTSTGPAAFETDAKPRLVGLSQPFFASNPPLESPNAQMAAVEQAAAEAKKKGGKVKVLVAEDNKTNQEVVLRMLKLEDIYDVTVAAGESVTI